MDMGIAMRAHDIIAIPRGRRNDDWVMMDCNVTGGGGNVGMSPGLAVSRSVSLTSVNAKGGGGGGGDGDMVGGNSTIPTQRE